MHPVHTVIERIQDATQRSSHNQHEVTLVAVSKTRPIEAILAAYEAGVRHFGENRADELAEKAQALSHLKDIKWHFIGNLQTRQSQPVSKYAHYFHAVDRLKIAQRLNTQLEQENRQLAVYIQVNISGEASKSGFDCTDWESNQQQRDTLVDALQQITALDHLQVIGLMTMAPWTAPDDTVRKLFNRLKELSVWLNESNPKLQANELSMGMSGDFETAIEEGATTVRVGSAIFSSE